MNDGRNPAECGWSIGFDGLYVCRLCTAPCASVGLCPRSGAAEANLKRATEGLVK